MNMPSIYGEDHQIFRKSVVSFFEKEAVPYHAQWEKDGEIDRDLWRKAGEEGFLLPSLPEEYGGAGGDFLYSAIICEEIGRMGLSGIGFTLHSDIVAPYILHHASEHLKKKYLPKMVTGEMVSAIAMTEPSAGSDLQSIQTTAVRKGDHYILNGSKSFITNGKHADLVLVAAKTNPKEGAKGTSLLLVEASSAGFTKGEHLEKVGMKAQDTCCLYFEDVKVPAENRLGHEGAGFAYMMNELSQERLTVCLIAQGSAEASLAQTIEYVKERQAFGKPIIGFQNTRFKLAEMKTKIAASRAFLDQCLGLHVQGKLDAATAAMLKIFTTDLQCEVADECLQLFGGYGYMLEYPIARTWIDSRVQKIYAGTNEIMKEIVARTL